MRQRRCIEMLLVIGYLKSRSCIGVLTRDHIYCVYIQKLWSLCWKSYMKAYAGVIQGVGLWRIWPLPRDIGGLACKEPPRIM